ncbi:MAG: DNA recombination protein RmuC [Desulfobulbaceae bacterium]|nr:DNA recombination protein RmuC [Desulfobulbaceae bacterium]
MTQTIYIAIAVCFGILCLVTGFLIAHLKAQREIVVLKQENMRLSTRLEMEERNQSEKLAALNQAEDRFKDTFAALSNQVLKSSNEEFLQLAQESMRQFHVQARADLEKRERSIHTLVEPIKEALHQTGKQIHRIEKERSAAYGNLEKYLDSMSKTQEQLQNETRNLVKALRRPEIRGRWGEMTLKRLVELAGMVEHCDFYEQEQIDGKDGAVRPDMIIRMADEREIVVDVKTPLDAYLNALESDDEKQREHGLKRHARTVRERVRELSRKAYWQQFEKAPDFVVMFIPGEQFLSAALDIDRTLLEDAIREKVILATPTSFIALLQVIEYGWRQQSLAENAEKIRIMGQDIYNRLATFGEHLARLGKNLGGSVESYNKAVGSLERQVLPGARKFTEMGVSPKKKIPELDPIESQVRL